jgi:TATA-binding protein-associated factor Taf7
MSHELYYHQQLILRLPTDLAENVSQILTQSKSIEAVHIEVVPQGTVKKSYGFSISSILEKSFFEFVYGEERYPALLGNLPCNIETHKTFDHGTYYKSGDISQVSSFSALLPLDILADALCVPYQRRERPLLPRIVEELERYEMFSKWHHCADC